jgi:hypothetical protein
MSTAKLHRKILAVDKDMVSQLRRDQPRIARAAKTPHRVLHGSHGINQAAPHPADGVLQNCRAALGTEGHGDAGPTIARQLAMPASTVGGILRRLGLGKLSALEPRPPVVCYQRERPGELLHIDTKKLGRIEAIGHRITGAVSFLERAAAWYRPTGASTGATPAARSRCAISAPGALHAADHPRVQAPGPGRALHSDQPARVDQSLSSGRRKPDP